MERLTENFKDGRNILRKGISDVFHVGFGRFFEGEAIDRLAEYEDLEEQGKLLKLPCAVGDTVYSFSLGKILILRVDSFIVYADRIDARLVSDMEKYKFLKVELDITDFGKKWFATHEEAEAALKEL